MADLDNATKHKLESVFDMSGGYVLDFSNARFSDFVSTSIGFDPYVKYQPASKAVLLRKIWHDQPDSVVAKLNLELLEHWRVSKLVSGVEPTGSESTLHDELKAQFASLVRSISAADTEFLAKDFSPIDFDQIPRSLSAQKIIEARLTEVDTCLSAGAPLAVIFLVGSTLEGLLLEIAKVNAQAFATAAGAPKEKFSGKVRPLDQWRLADLIAVSHALGILSDDVFKFADHVRAFRNYIHPSQQLAEGFEPRAETAQIARQVLLAALHDIERLSDVD